MKDNEHKVNLPLFKTSWTTFKDEPAPQSVQKSNHCPSGKRLLNPIYTVKRKYADESQSESVCLWYFQVIIMSIRINMSTLRRFILPKIYKSSRLMVGK